MTEQTIQSIAALHGASVRRLLELLMNPNTSVDTVDRITICVVHAATRMPPNDMAAASARELAAEAPQLLTVAQAILADIGREDGQTDEAIAKQQAALERAMGVR